MFSGWCWMTEVMIVGVVLGESKEGQELAAAAQPGH